MLPKGGVDCVQDLIIAEMEESKRVGLERYGSTLQTFNGRRSIQDVAEEVRDLHVYIKQIEAEAEAERGTLVQVVYDAIREDLGGNVDSPARLAASQAVDAIMGWVVGQRVGSLRDAEEVYQVLDDAWPQFGHRAQIIESQAHAIMDRLGIEASDG